LITLNVYIYTEYIYIYIQGDQKVSVHLMITIQSSGAQRFFDHPEYIHIQGDQKVFVHLIITIQLSGTRRLLLA